jgi:serine/threonine protein kinase
LIGEPLSAELPKSQHSDKRWSEAQCIELLNDVLGILAFVHSQGVIHCDLKPNNLIRRTSDGRLVLIDFGATYSIHPTRLKQQFASIQPSNAPLTIRPLGYIPPEQLNGQPYPNSDLYALGMIALQALTGLNPGQLQAEPDTGKVNWQQHVSVSDPLASVLNRMVVYDFKHRYQSATYARTALKRLMISTQEQEVSMSKEELSNPSPSVVQPPSPPPNTEPLDLGVYAGVFARSCWPKLPPLVTGIGAGMATSNAVAISVGLYTLLHSAPSNPGVDLLVRATEQYQAGNFKEAIALAKSIPTDSSAYQESLSAMQQWRQEWKTAAAQFKAVEEAFNEKRWRDVLIEARKCPNIAFWKNKIEPFVEQATPELEVEAQQLLQQAYERAALKDFTGAIAFIKQIPQETPTWCKNSTQAS